MKQCGHSRSMNACTFVQSHSVWSTNHGFYQNRLQPRRSPQRIHITRHAKASAPAPTQSSTSSSDRDPYLSNPLFPQTEVENALKGTMLSSKPLSLAYAASRDGFDNVAFFEQLIPLGGVPSLVLGRTDAGILFGGYAASGFLARDDYRESATERSMFVFRLYDDGQLVIAEATDGVQYDFYDYAIRFGAALLGIPMNPRKHVMKADVGTSSCRLPNGETSVLGDSTLSRIDELQVWVAKQYLDEVDAKKAKKGPGFFAKLFA